MMIVFIINLILLFHYVSCLNVNSTCNYNNTIQFGREYFIVYPGYPGNYTGPLGCRWTYQSPQNSVIVTRCNLVNLPNTQNCSGDSLVFSPTGDPNFQDGYTMSFCGQTPFTELSYGQQMTLGLFSSSGGTGRFLCSIAAIRPAQNCQCGLQLQTTFVGGQQTGQRQYPFLAALVDTTGQVPICGATIITARHALTAAHCLTNQTADNIELLAGARSINQTQSTTGALYDVQSFFIMPRYNATYNQNDIAVIQTSNPIQFNLFVSPVCMPFIFGRYNFEGAPVVALGWNFGNTSNTLQEVNLTVVNSQQCAAQIPTITITSLCTNANNNNTCIGNSGGPVVWREPYTNRLELVAIASGNECAGNPEVNMGILSFISWIVSATSPAGAYCF